MRILALGDVVGQSAIAYLQKHLWSIRTRERIDLAVVNGENGTDIHGLCTADAKILLESGADVLTLGNHTYGKRDLCAFLEDDPRIIRPANYPPTAPGSGYTIQDAAGWRVLCINVSGRAFMEPLNDPFEAVERILSREEGRYDLAVMDIHAEATSEKIALARVFDGRVQVLFGTHTHVPTADEQILPKGSGYITDLGMCGPISGILGTNAEQVIYKLRTAMPTRFDVAEGEIRAHGAIFDLDPATKKVTEVKRITF
ncbi:MAG: YmdB family metallophosphoesterase [Clostridia bacterium]|nr:YmdB family metallophosphoesterase [Clostridia bacterium]